MFIRLRKNTTTSFQHILVTPERNAISMCSRSLSPPCPSPWRPVVSSLFTGLPTLDLPPTQNHATHGLLRLAYCLHRELAAARVGCSVCRELLLPIAIAA